MKHKDKDRDGNELPIIHSLYAIPLQILAKYYFSITMKL